MNEKIKEFAEQAWPGLPSHWWDRRDGEVAEAVNKFAELIVAECIAITDELVNCNRDGTWTSNELYTDYNGALSEVKRRITEHFELNCYTQEDLDEAHKRGVELAKKLRVE